MSMTSLIEKKLQKFPSDYLTYADLCILLPLTDNARYAQIKRALQEGLLVRLRKGLYRRGQYLEKKKPHPFEMSQNILWPSYVSLESALSFYGLIPEAVYSTTCVTMSRSQKIENEFGLFSYQRLPKNNFFYGVSREVEDESIFLVATPWKAIMDYVFCYKKNWKNIAPLDKSLRIELKALPPLTVEMAKKLSFFYNSSRVQKFIDGVVKYYEH